MIKLLFSLLEIKDKEREEFFLKLFGKDYEKAKSFSLSLFKK
jgi:hypothetical protein